MAIKEEKQHLDLIERYYKEPGSRAEILKFFLKHFEPEIDAQWKFAKLSPSIPERDSEAVNALLDTFAALRDKPDTSLEKSFRNQLKRSIRNTLAIRKNHIDINSSPIMDPSGSPEDQYILKEQMDLLKEFIRYNYDTKTFYQFQLYFMDGWTSDEIGLEFGVTGRSVSKRMAVVYERAQRYMKRINNE